MAIGLALGAVPAAGYWLIGRLKVPDTAACGCSSMAGSAASRISLQMFDDTMDMLRTGFR